MLENTSKQRILWVAGIIIFLLLVTNAVLLINKSSQNDTIEQQQTELDEAARVKAELDKQYNAALEELDAALAENAGLKEEIEAQRTELKKERDRISKMISQGKANSGELEKARAQIRELMEKQNDFLSRIEELEAENQALAETTAQLSSEKEVLTEQVQQERQNSEALQAEKARVEAEKQTLESEKQELSETVNFASVIKVQDVEVKGYSIKSSGKLSRKRYAKNVEMLRICFNVTPNEVAEAGDETFYIRIITPEGSTLAVEELGSGTMVNRANKEQLRYTFAKDISYNKGTAEVCADFQSNSSFPNGNYTIEIYNKGYLCGKSDFKLR